MKEDETDHLPRNLENALSLLKTQSPEPRAGFLAEIDGIPERFPRRAGSRWRFLGYAVAASVPLVLGYAADGSSGTGFDSEENEAREISNRQAMDEFTSTHLDELEAWTLSEEGTLP